MEAYATALASPAQPDAGGDAAGSGMDDVWYTLRDVLWQVHEAELAWNALAPRGEPAKPQPRPQK